MTSSAYRALDKLNAQVPNVACKGLCHHSCSFIDMGPAERQRIIDAGGPHIGPFQTKPGTDDCPALTDDKRCSVYRVRPMICRLWGAADDPLLTCPHGCTAEAGERVLRDDQARALLAAATAITPPEGNRATRRGTKPKRRSR